MNGVRALVPVALAMAACSRSSAVRAVDAGGAMADRHRGPVGAMRAVRVASVEVEGPFAREAVVLLAHGRLDAVRACNPRALQGHLVVCARLDDTGRVLASDVPRTLPGDPTVAACAQREVGTWRVPVMEMDASARRGEIRVVYAFGESDGRIAESVRCVGPTP